MSAVRASEQKPIEEPTHGPTKLPTWIWVVAALAVLSLIFVLGVRAVRRSQVPPLPVLGRVPTFALKDQKGQTVTHETFRGKVWVADFIFLGCQMSCPKLTARMKDLQDRIEARAQKLGKPLPVQLVSLSVDPENDTPDALAAYGKKFGANDARWSFLTGSAKDLDAIVVQGFKMQYAPKGAASTDKALGGDDPNVFTIMHGDWFIVVDREGQLRGYYDSGEPQQLDKLMFDVERLSFGDGKS